jgi:ABC-type sugar transport system ATPase subunit
MAAPLVAAQEISKSFGLTRALDGVSLSVAPGSVHGLIGPNGSGKSTLIRMLTGMETPDRGNIVMDGTAQPHWAAGQARALGVELVPQELALVPVFKVWENIVLGAEAHGLRMSKSDDRAKARAVLDELGLDIGVDEDMLTLDPGEQRLVMFARTFHRKARLLIADEPTAGLGEKDSRTVIDALKRLRARGVTMIFVSHYLSEVMETCDEVTVMRDGRVAARLSGASLTLDRMIREMAGVHAERNVPARSAARKEKLIIEGRHLAMPPLRQLNFKLYENECLGPGEGDRRDLGGGPPVGIGARAGRIRRDAARGSSRRRGCPERQSLSFDRAGLERAQASEPALARSDKPLRVHRRPPRARGRGSRRKTPSREGRARG